MPKFSLRSKERLATCHEDIRKVCNALIKTYDISVLEGHRGKAEQEKYVKAGKSQLHFPKSKHNALPSLAVDLAPYPVDWEDAARFKEMWEVFKAVAQQLKERGEITARFAWGGEWKKFKDYPHIEIVKEKE